MAALVSPSVVNFPNDPYLQYQPAFAYTLPVQLLCAGVTLTLLVVLGIHLLFTVQYHYPLAPLNYCLQLSSLVACLVSVLIKIIVILQSTADNGDTWPYSIVYVAVNIPPSSWNKAQNVLWFFLQALCVGLSNITHIQFLTLLFPSRTEARLIIFILGPLAIASSGLVFVALANDQKALDVGDAIRNVLNSTLLIIFTSALFLWGLVVNRRRAWRNDGGTSMFGLGSLLLAVVSTSCNIVAVVEDGIDWLQHMLLAAILWQIWLGWWWWVGSGMGIGEVEDIMERAERKKRKAAKRAARTRQMPKRTRSLSIVQLSDAPATAASAIGGLTSSVTGILRNRSIRGAASLTRRRISQSAAAGSPMGDVEEGIEMGSVTPSPTASRGPRRARNRNRDREADVAEENSTASAPAGIRRSAGSPQQHVEFSSSAGPEGTRPFTSTNTNSETSSTSQTPSLHAPRTVGQFVALPTTWLQIYLRRLRHAHEDATKKQALKRAEKRQRVFGSGDSRAGGVLAIDPTGASATAAEGARVLIRDEADVGWGLGRFGIAEHEASVRRLRESGAQLQVPEGDRGSQRRRSTSREPTPSATRRNSATRRASAGEGGENGEVAGIERLDGIAPDEIPGRGRSSTAGPEAATPSSGTGEADAEDKDEQARLAPDGSPEHERPTTRARAESGGRLGARGRDRERGRETSVEPDTTDWEDMDSSSDSGETNDQRRRRGETGQGGGGGGWWDALRNWRRTDKATF